MKVGILGTGMSGFVAAHAVRQHDHTAQIVMYGADRRPIASGARWYERMIPGLDVTNRMCSVQSAGDADDYSTKVGGPISLYFKARPEFLAFNYWEGYEKLYDAYNSNIIQLEPDHKLIQSSSWDDFDYVINTSPRPNFYSKEEHGMFAATRHWRVDEHFEGKMPYVLPGKADKQLMIFDATEDSSYFRISQLFGLMSVEWGFHKKPPIAGSYIEILPLQVAPEVGLRDTIAGWRGTKAMAHVGAVARWEPSTDVGEVFRDVTKVLEGDYGDDDSGGHI